MNNELLYELILQDPEDEVFAVSFVDKPAIERDFVFFGKEIQFQAIDEERRLVAGPLLIPNKKILRLDGESKPYYVFFKPDTIEAIARKFMAKKFNDKVTTEHDKTVKDVYLTESWLVGQSGKDKSNMYGFTLPMGTWFGVYKVENNDVWNKVKKGEFRGFSIEGLFEHKKSDLNLSKEFEILEKDITELSEVEANIVLNKIKNVLKSDNRFKKGQRIDVWNMEGESPTIVSSYAGQFGPGKKKKKVGEYIHPALISTKK